MIHASPNAPPEDAADWMREAALLAAELMLQTPPDAPLSPRAGWSWQAGAWAPLLRRAQARALLPGQWVEAAAAAAERHPDAAAAFSLLAENDRQMLPTPAAFARIAVAGLGLPYDVALAAALAPSPRLERVELSGQSLPAAACGLRLSAEGLSGLFRPRLAVGERLDALHRPVMVRAAAAAALILERDGAVWIRARSQRLARQLALDLATRHPARAVRFVTLRPDDPMPGAEADDALMVADLFALDHPPRLPVRGSGLVVVAPERMDHGGLRAVDAPPLGPAEAAAVWAEAGVTGAGVPGLETQAHRFRLTLPELLAARTEAETLMSLRAAPGGLPPGPPDAAALTRAILQAGARRMGPFVTTVEADVTLDDLVCTPALRAQLEDAVAWRRTDARVWGEMDLPRDSGASYGLALLFSGPPGGGKTFAARCLAHALGLNLYRVDLSQVVSKYIGETEKRLAQIFDEAEAGHGILFFDEADAVFGKRTEVKDAHDRYANIEAGFLLQRMESYGGVVVLATNLRGNMDAAFTRRMQFIVDFPMPGRAERAALWQRHLPGPAWRDPGLDVGMLAERFRLAGGNIRNAAIAAAHLAAADHAPVADRHLARALVRELEKSGLPRGSADLGPLSAYVEEAGCLSP
jgi:hypothetical protein